MSTSPNRRQQRLLKKQQEQNAKNKSSGNRQRKNEGVPLLTKKQLANTVTFLCQNGLPVLAVYLIMTNAAVIAAAHEVSDKNVTADSPVEKIDKDRTNITIPAEGPETWVIGNITGIMKRGDDSNKKFFLVAGPDCEEEIAALGLYDRYLRSMSSNGNELNLTSNFVKDLDNPQHPNKFPVKRIILAGEDTASEYLFIVSGKTGTGLTILSNESASGSEKRERVSVEINGKMVQKYLNATKSPQITLSKYDEKTGKVVYADINDTALNDTLATMASLDDSKSSVVPVGPTLDKQGYVLAVGDYGNASNADEIQQAQDDGSYFFFHAKTKHKALEFLSTLIAGGINSGKVRLDDGCWKIEDPLGNKSVYSEITVKDEKVANLQMINERRVKVQNEATRTLEVDYTKNQTKETVEEALVTTKTQEAFSLQKEVDAIKNSELARSLCNNSIVKGLSNLRHYIP